MANESLVSIRKVSKSYGKTGALKNVSLELKSGSIVGLLGPNGSGKTTLIKILCGLINNYTGEVVIDNHHPDEHTKAIVSYLPDRDYLTPWMKGKDIIKTFKDFYADFDEKRMNELLTRLDIDPNKTVKELSKGTLEKLQLCLVMSRRANIYILDEPIGGVDPAARDLIINTILNNYQPGSLVIIATHLISEVESILNSVIFLNKGEVMLFDEAEALRTRENKSIDELFREEFKC